MNFDEAEKLLDEGKLEMMRPWGDFVRVSRARSTQVVWRHRVIEVHMEADVLARISTAQDRLGQPCLRQRVVRAA